MWLCANILSWEPILWFAKSRPWIKMHEPLKYEQHNGSTRITVNIKLQTCITNGLALYSWKRHFNKEQNNVTMSQWTHLFCTESQSRGKFTWVKSLTQIRVITHWECIYVFLSEMLCAISQKFRKVTGKQAERLLPFSITPSRRSIKEAHRCSNRMKP